MTVSLGESADDGEDGEGDDVDADIEIIRGGRSSDFLAGTPARRSSTPARATTGSPPRAAAT